MIHTTLKTCIAVNAFSLIILTGLCIKFCEQEVPFMKFGPQSSLIVLGVTINTWNRYVILQMLICVFQITDVVVNEFASPILGFNIYNPDKKTITDFTKLQLQVYCQSMWFINNLKSALMLLVTISQLDIAISKVVYAEIASVFTIRALINKKEFRTKLSETRNDLEESFIPVKEEQT